MQRLVYYPNRMRRRSSIKSPLPKPTEWSAETSGATTAKMIDKIAGMTVRIVAKKKALSAKISATANRTDGRNGTKTDSVFYPACTRAARGMSKFTSVGISRAAQKLQRITQMT